jgi:hypothetical protein
MLAMRRKVEIAMDRLTATECVVDKFVTHQPQRDATADESSWNQFLNKNHQEIELKK